MLGFSRRSVKFGGIKPAAFKEHTLRSRIMPTPLPAELLLSLQQHQGDAAVPVVNVGDKVLKFDLIAKASDTQGLNLHAPTSGEIVSVSEEIDPFGSGITQRCIRIQCDGEDNSTSLRGTEDYRLLSAQECLQRVRDAGVCGMGGAGFPTATKLQHSIEKACELVLVNAAECEPYISCDEALIRERAEAVVLGAEVLQYITSANSAQIVIEADKLDAISSLRRCLADSPVELKLVKPLYPAGDESQLIYGATGREIPADSLPSDIGIAVINAGTATSVAAAVVEGKPCISRIVTLAGSALQTPKNFDALLGMPANHLLALAGIDSTLHKDTIVGGSLMGKYLLEDDSPISKTSNCIIATSVNEFPSQPEAIACIRCGFCADACPAHLLPQQLYRYAKENQLDLLADHGLRDCIECGACAYVCPSKIPLVQYYRWGKEALAEEDETKAHSTNWQQRFHSMQFRRKRIGEQNARAKSTASQSAGHTKDFSRDQARAEIAAAVARVKKKRAEAPE